MQTLPVGEERQWRRQINWSASALRPKTTRTYQSNVKGRISTTSWLLPEGSFLFAAHTFTVAINLILWICFQTGVCHRMTQDYQVVYVIFIDFGTLSSIFSRTIGSNRILTGPRSKPQVSGISTQAGKHASFVWGHVALFLCLESVWQASASFPPQIPQPWRQIKATTLNKYGFCEDEGVTNFNLCA